MLLKGSVAPDFILYASDKSPVQLSQYKGKNVLILFFPLAFTSTCTKELCMMRDDLTRYNDLNTVILGISTDSPQSLARYKEEQRLNFTLLSDYNREVSRAYDAQYEEYSLGMRGVAKRAAFVVDKTGVIQYAEVLENASHLPNFDAINSTLNGLK
jgi:peroxiredoxin